MALFEHISVQQKKEFTKNLSVMLKSGMTLNEALFLILNQTQSKAFSKALSRVQKKVMDGKLFSESLALEKDYFGAIVVSIARAGESSGRLPDNLEFLSRWFERSDRLRRDIKAALLYPKIVIAVTVLLGGILSAFVLPRLIPLFDSLGVELPGATLFLISLIKFTQAFWLVILLALFGMVSGFIVLSRNATFRYFLDRAYLKVPVFGSLLKNYQLALITQVLDTLLKGGLSIHEVLIITRDAVDNSYYARVLEEIRSEVQSGATMSSAAKKYPDLFPATFTGIIEVGEKTGSLADSVGHLQEHFSEEVTQMTRRIPQVVEPLLLVCIALIVGFIAIAIITPLYEVTRGLSR